MQKSRKRKTKEENKEQDNDTNIKVVGIIHVVLLIFVTMPDQRRLGLVQRYHSFYLKILQLPGTIFIKEV